MAKPTSNAVLICLALTALLIIGVFWGIIKSNPLIIIFFLLPAIIYESYRTEGVSTRWASWSMLAIVILEIIFIIFKIKFNLAEFLGSSEKYIGGFYIPLGDLKVIFPSLLAVLSVILFIRTAGVYTKWLSVLIFIGSFAIIYAMSPNVFIQLLKVSINQAINYIRF